MLMELLGPRLPNEIKLVPFTSRAAKLRKTALSLRVASRMWNALTGLGEPISWSSISVHLCLNLMVRSRFLIPLV